MKFKTRYIFSNRKTKWAVDFGVCPFMYKNVNNSYVSDTCPGCYSARLLNVYPGTRRKLESLDIDHTLLPDFEDDVRKIAATGHRFLRFYSLGDFGSEHEIEFIHAAANITKVEIFSKTLHSQYINSLSKVASHTNVHISLSLNKSWDLEYTRNLWKYLIDNGLAKNVQLNYTFIGDEPIELKPYTSVYHHTTPTGKVKLKQLFGKNRVCCMKDENGKEILDNKISNSKGSCAKCSLCQLPAADGLGQILTPRKLNELYQK
jgi:hypothetical protein